MPAKNKNEEIIDLTHKYVANTYGRFPITLVRGKGIKVWDRAGREYLDFVTGLAVNSLGHCHPSVVSAIQKQAGQLLHVSNLYHIEPQARLAQALTKVSFADKVFFCNSGTEANEGAIKLARRYSFDQGYKNRYEIITMENSFHGRTYGGLSATAQTKFHNGFQPLLPGFKYVPFNDIKAVEKAVTSKTCAVLLEPVQGEGGVYPANKNYLKALKKLCQQKDLLLIFDEVQTGFGRTGKLFAYEHYEVKPDIITWAKALGGGMAIGAMGGSKQVMKSLVPGTHAATFGGNPLACSAALASLQVLNRKGFLEKSCAVGNYFESKLKELAQSQNAVNSVRGTGLMLALELNVPATSLVTDCMKKGFLINCVQQNTLRFLPPLTVSKKDINGLLKVLKELLGKLPS